MLLAGLHLPSPFAIILPKPGRNFTLGHSLPIRVSQNREALESLSGVVTDKNVPEGHQNLHTFLYGQGEDAAGVHSSASKAFLGREGEDDGSTVLPFADYVSQRESLRFAGVYAVYDNHQKLQYIGYSRNVLLSLKDHRAQIGEKKCSFVRVKLFSNPYLISRANLEEERQKWLTLADIPPGNSCEQDLWENNTRGSSVMVMSDEERTEYEDKKLKMRKAMGDNLYDEVEGETQESRIRRLQLLQAIEGDDWSAVIDGQTKQTIVEPKNQRSVSEEKEQHQIASPFSEPEVARSKSLYSAESFELTFENVDEVLNNVRPYLIADGGNVEVVSVGDGVISLRLQGACGTCPSSTTTMKLGVEKVLKEKFGSALKEVVQIDQQNFGASVTSVNAHLDILRPAIHNYGGSIEVLSVLNGKCEVKFKGPPQIAMGIQAAIKDKFPDISSVVLLDV